MFSLQELQSILALIGRATIKGNESTTVAILMQKITGLIKEETKEQQSEGESKEE